SGGGFAAADSWLDVKNSIVWGGAGGQISTSGSLVNVTYSNVQGGQVGLGNLSTDPLFVDAPGGDFHLRSGSGHWTPGGWVIDPETSPCIDAGDPADSFAAEPEDNGDRINMGAYGNTLQASKASARTPVVYVDADAVGANCGTDWTNAYTDLQSALAVPVADFEVWVAEGTYKPGAVRTDTFALKSGASIYGGFAGTEDSRGARNPAANVTVLSGDIGAPGDAGDNCYHVVTSTTGGEVHGFTVSGGNANGTGVNAFGGGLYVSGTTVTVTDCRFTGNSGAYGAAVAALSGATPSLSGSVFAGNTASSDGGAFHIRDGGNTVVMNCVLYGNAAASGGGLHTQNSACILQNSIVWGNTGGQVSSVSSTANVTYCAVQGGHAGTGNIADDPLFADAAGGNFHLKSHVGRWTSGGWVNDSAISPCIAAGDPMDPYDIEPAPNGARINMGAYGNSAQASKWGLTNVIYVNVLATGDNDGTSWANAYTSLQSALAVATSGKEIWVAAGTYAPTTGTSRTASFVLKNGVELYGGFDAAEMYRSERDVTLNITILSGDIGTLGDASDNSYHVVTGKSGGTIDGFTITAGRANGSGNNADGGGMFNNYESPTVRNCTFNGNYASGRGGGMANLHCAPTVTDCALEGNSAVSYGGGVYNNDAAASFSGCTFAGNSAWRGGGLGQESSLGATFTNCIFRGNAVTSQGGGSYHYWSSAIFRNCTYYANSAPAGRGGAICSRDVSTVQVRNCILWGDTGGEVQALATVAATYSNVQGGYGGTGNTNVDPLYADAAGGDLHLQSQEGRWTPGGWVTDAATSPCIDSGNPADSWANEPEDNGDRVNMGAYGNTAQASMTPSAGAPVPPPLPEDEDPSDEMLVPPADLAEPPPREVF
ncbi:MAG: hypothetical protein ACYTGB_17285, partial [Planctomycetota bacterium]